MENQTVEGNFNSESIHGFKLVSWSDIQFAEWLFQQDSRWTYKSYDLSTNYLTVAGKILAVVYYNNQECTRKIWVKEDLL